jgi:hypothetical protein
MNGKYSQPIGNDFSAVRTAKWQDTNRFKYIRISNQERTSGTPSNFQVNLGNDTILDRCEQIQLISAVIPNVSYNVSAARGNNRFNLLFLPNTDASFTVPDGQYTTADLVARLGLVLPPLGAFTVSQNAITGKITLNATVSPYVVGGSASFPNTSGLNSYLGFTTPSPAGGTLLHTAEARPSLFGDTMFFIHSPELGANITYLDTLTTGGQTNDVNGMFSIPVNVPYNAVQAYQAEAEDRVVFGRRTRSVRNFSIVLRANNGRELTLSENDQVIIVMKAIFAVDQH